MENVIFDSDDFAMQPDRNCMRELLHIKEKFPNFKTTLFAVPAYEGFNQSQFFRMIIEKYGDWIQLAMHGFCHSSNFECSKWDYNTAKTTIRQFSDMFSVQGFKAPGWQISRETYKACLDLDFWVADHKESAYTEPGVPNSERRPEGLKVYEIDHPWMLHTHTWNCVGNGLPEMIEKWEKDGYPFDKSTKFHFIDDWIKDEYS